MKSIASVATLVAVVLFANSAAFAESEESRGARIAALEKENALMRKELAALRQNHALRDQKASIAGASEQAHGNKLKKQDQDALMHSNGSGSPLNAYAADLAFKTPPIAEARGQFRVWAEGGATWTGGDPSLLFYTPVSLTLNDSPSQSFDLKPRLGWEAAGGFDYRFANSPYHVSGQFRYGQGTGRGSFGTSGSVDPSLLSPGLTSVTASQAIAAEGKESHWLADLAVGRDVLGSGPSSMQVKAGLRISEFRASTSSLQVVNETLAFNPPALFNGILLSSVTETSTTNLTQEARFLGAGPRVGIEGSVPFAGNWAFDYLGDAAVLFGTQRYSQVQNGFLVANVPGFPTIPGVGFANSDERSATVFNADLQFGVSYWFTPAVKMTASYRLDAYFKVLTGLSVANDVTQLQTVDRYIHGPRLAVTAQF